MCVQVLAREWTRPPAALWYPGSVGLVEAQGTERLWVWWVGAVSESGSRTTERKLSLPPALPALAETDAPCGSPCGLSASAKWVLKPSMMGLPVMHSCSPEPGPPFLPPTPPPPLPANKTKGAVGPPRQRGVWPGSGVWLHGLGWAPA